MITRVLLPRIIQRTGTRLALTFMSLMFGALTLGLVLGIIGSVQSFFESESQSLQGGDITIEADQAIDRTLPELRNLEARGAEFSERIETLIVVTHGSEAREGTLASLLTSLKVVDAAYPLYGTLETEPKGAPLTDSSVLVAPDVLARMGLTIGDTLTIGNQNLTIAGTIVREPDSVGSSFRLGPVVMISRAAWDNIGIDTKQSRIDYILAVRFPDTLTSTERTALNELISNSFTRPAYRVSLASDGPSSLLRTLESAREFFFFMIVLALFLAIINIRLNLIFFLASFQKTIAIMRSLGMQRTQLVVLFVTLLSLLAGAAGLLGGILGNALAHAALPYAEGVIGTALPRLGLFTNVGIVTLFTLFLCLFAAIGFLERTLAIEPKLLLHGYGTEHSKGTALRRELPALILTLLGLYGGIFLLTGEALGALIAVGSVTGAFILIFLLARGMITLFYRARFKFSFVLRSIVSFLHHQGMLSATTIASLTIALASIFSIALIEQNVLGNLNTEFKEDAPNIYLIDIQEEQLPFVRSLMGESWKDFGVVRGRFLERDGYDIQANLETEDRELRREFNLTSGTTLIDGETLIEGVWHGTTGKKEVSLERDFAERAKLSVGNTIVFLVQGVRVEATVTSIRDVVTTNGLPFFYLVFSPDVLAGIPYTSFGYAYVPETEIPVVQNKLAVTYPNISSIPTAQILETVEKVVATLSIAVVAVALPALALGILLIIAMLALTAQERSNDMLVFTSFGARMRLIVGLFFIESSIAILITGLLALILSYTGVYLLNIFIFDFRSFYQAPYIFGIFGAVLFITLVIALYFGRQFVRRTPKELLGKNG